jgi:hypothetical protein
LRCAPRWQSLAFRHRHSLNMAVAGMAEVVVAVLTVAAEAGVSTAEAAEAGVTLISVVADVLPGVREEQHRARFQGRALVGIVPTELGRTA